MCSREAREQRRVFARYKRLPARPEVSEFEFYGGSLKLELSLFPLYQATTQHTRQIPSQKRSKSCNNQLHTRKYTQNYRIMTKMVWMSVTGWQSREVWCLHQVVLESILKTQLQMATTVERNHQRPLSFYEKDPHTRISCPEKKIRIIIITSLFVRILPREGAKKML